MDLGFAFVSDEVLVIAISVILATCLIGALLVSRRRTDRLLTPVTFFFLFAFVHAFFAFYSARVLSSRYTFVGPATLDPFVNQSFLIIATGLTCCLLSYVLIPRMSAGRIGAVLVRVSNEEAFARVCARSRILIVLAIPLIVIGLQRLGGIPLLSDSPRNDRYLLNFTPEHRLDTFLVNRGRETIVFPAIALAVGWYFNKRRIVDVLFVVVAAISCLLTATRAPLLIGVSIATVVLVWKNRFSAVFITAAMAFLVLIGSEIALGVDSDPTAQWTTLERIGADVAEARDLAWVLVKHDQPYWGRTFIAGLLPIPSFASDFTQTYHLRTVTLEAIGIPLTAAHGGLRVTYSGEWYLNFGWPGVVLGGLLYGWMCSWFSSLFHRQRAARGAYPIGTFMLACAWVTVSFMIYMAGTGAGGTLKTYGAVLAVLLFRLPRSAARVPAHRSALGLSSCVTR